MSRHSIAAEHIVLFTFPGLAEGDHESAKVKIEIAYEYDADGDPLGRYSPSMTLVEAVLTDGDGLGPTQSQVNAWAEDWLDDEGCDRALDHAESEQDTSEPCTAASRRAGCTCGMESVHSASIDPPEPVVNLNCPLHGNAAARDPDYARDIAIEDARWFAPLDQDPF